MKLTGAIYQIQKSSNSNMDISKSKGILKKINALHESAEAFDNSLSKMERDLLLHYLREMYEIVLDGANSGFDETELPTASPAPVRHSPQIVQQSVREERAQDIVERSEMAVNPNGEIAASANEVKKVVFEAEKAEKIKVATYDVEMEALFEESSSKEISSRFSSLPIADISKSMGINDRILTINELFKGNQAAFNLCVQKLNTFSNIDEAKEFLSENDAKENKWTSPKRVKKSKVFVDLIRRRYL